MALTNIRREPQREITETVVGVAIVAGVVGFDYCLGLMIAPHTSEKSVLLGMLLGVIAIAGTFVVGFLSIGLTIVIHDLGEGVCNALERRGLHLRPRRRR